RQSVQRAVANHARTIRVPVHVVERQQKLSRAARRLEVELGREATKFELAEATGLPMQHVDEALGAAHASVSLNQTVGADDEGELRRRAAEEGPDQEELVEVAGPLPREGAARGGEARLGLEVGAAARRQRPHRGDAAGGDEDRPGVPRLYGRHDEAPPYPLQA